MEKLKVLLVEDDPTICQEYISDTNEMCDDFNLIGVTNNSEKALQYVEEAFPDAVILDLELHNGGGSGIDFLSKLKTMTCKKPFVLVSTNNISSVAHTIARELGADFIMTKNQENFSAKTVLDFLKITKSVILEKRTANQINQEAIADSSAQITKKLTNQICHKFNAIGINPKAVGYNYLVDAVLMVINDDTQHICDKIGKKYNKTSNSVERAMQNAINQTWSSSDINVLLSQYTARIKSEKGVPTITEFIYYYARKLKNDM